MSFNARDHECGNDSKPVSAGHAKCFNARDHKHSASSPELVGEIKLECVDANLGDSAKMAGSTTLAMVH